MTAQTSIELENITEDVWRKHCGKNPPTADKCAGLGQAFCSNNKWYDMTVGAKISTARGEYTYTADKCEGANFALICNSWRAFYPEGYTTARDPCKNLDDDTAEEWATCYLARPTWIKRIESTTSSSDYLRISNSMTNSVLSVGVPLLQMLPARPWSWAQCKQSELTASCVSLTEEITKARKAHRRRADSSVFTWSHSASTPMQAVHASVWAKLASKYYLSFLCLLNFPKLQQQSHFSAFKPWFNSCHFY